MKTLNFIVLATEIFEEIIYDDTLKILTYQT